MNIIDFLDNEFNELKMKEFGVKFAALIDKYNFEIFKDSSDAIYSQGLTKDFIKWLKEEKITINEVKSIIKRKESKNKDEGGNNQPISKEGKQKMTKDKEVETIEKSDEKEPLEEKEPDPKTEEESKEIETDQGELGQKIEQESKEDENIREETEEKKKLMDSDAQKEDSKIDKLNEKKTDFGANEKNFNEDEKLAIVSRNIMRIYKFLHKDEEIDEEKIMEEIDVGTPKEVLHNKIQTLKLDLELFEEENQALRQNALQSQIQYEEQVEMIELENVELNNELKQLRNKYKNKIEEVENEIKRELSRRSKEYKNIIADLRKKLNEALGRNTKFSEFITGFEKLQNKMLKVVKENEFLETNINKFQREHTSLLKEHEGLEREFASLENKYSEIQKKVDLQKNVINGYKRKFGII